MKAKLTAGLAGEPGLRIAGLAALAVPLTLFLSSCAPVELPGDPVQACRSGIQEACGILALQQRSMQQLARPIQPVQVYRSRESQTNCQRFGDTMQCQTTSY